MKREWNRPERLGPWRVMVVGVGGLGVQVARLIHEDLAVPQRSDEERWHRHDPRGDAIRVDTVACDADACALDQASVPRCVQVGRDMLRGLGAGGDPELARQAADEGMDELAAMCAGAHLVFVAAGLGGGTGTGLAPLVARRLRSAAVPVVALASMPFESEGPIRSGNAVEALTRLRAAAETTLVFPLDRLHATMSKDSPLVQLMRDVERHMAAPVYALAALDTWPGSAVICRGTADACLEIRDAVDLLLAAGWGTAAEAASKRGEGMQETLAAAMSHPLIREWLPLPERSLLVGCLPETCAADEFLQAWQAVRSRRVDGAPHLVSLGSLPERVTPGVRAFVVVAGRDCRPVRIGL